MPPAIDGRNKRAVGKSVEGERARQAHHMAAIDDPFAEPTRLLQDGVKMPLGCILVEPRCDLVLGLFDGHSINMIDLLADLVIFKEMPAPGKNCVVAREIQIVRNWKFFTGDL